MTISNSENDENAYQKMEKKLRLLAYIFHVPAATFVFLC
jgi:hypothetical protein